MMEQHPPGAGMDPNYGAHMSSGGPHGHSGSLPQGGTMPPPGYPTSAGGGQTVSQGGAYPQKPSGPLSIMQLKFLSSQIKAYRCLARNSAIPDHIRSVILSHASSIGNTTPPRSSSPGSQAGGGTALSSTAPPTSASPAPSQQQSADTAQKPLTAGGDSAQSSSPKPDESKGDNKPAAAAVGGQPPTTATPPTKPQTQIRQAKLAPPVKPRGLDPDLILKERESRYYSTCITDLNLRFIIQFV